MAIFDMNLSTNNIVAVSQDDVGIAPDLASVDLSAGDTPRPSEKLMLLAQPSYKTKNVVPVVSKYVL